MLPMSFNFTIDYRAAKFKMHEQRTHAASTQTPYTENSKFHSGVRYIIECQRGLVIKSKWVFHEFEHRHRQFVAENEAER